MIGKAVRTGIGNGRGIDKGAICVKRKRPMIGAGYHLDSKRITVDIDIIPQHTGHTHRQGESLGGAVIIRYANRCIIDCRDRKANDCRATGSRTIVGLIREGIGTVIINRGRINKGAVGLQRECPMTRSTDQRRCERIAFDIAIIGQDARQADG